MMHIDCTYVNAVESACVYTWLSSHTNALLHLHHCMHAHPYLVCVNSQNFCAASSVANKCNHDEYI